MIERLIELGLRNRLLMTVLTVGVMAAGYWTYRGLPVDAFPDVSPNLVQIFTVTEGLAPEEVEKYVTYPIEAAMTGLPGIEQIRSVSNFGLSVVNVYFEDGMDIYFCRRLVNERLQEARDQIPEGFGEPEMGPISTGMGLILFYYLEDATGRYDLEELRTIQDWIIKFHLQTVPGVTEVLGIGGFEKQYHVVVDPDALLRYDLTLGEIIERVEANNLNVGAQYIEKFGEQFIVRSVGLAHGIEDLESIVVKTIDGRPIFLRDIAEIRIGGATRFGLQTRNGEKEVVAGMVIKLYGENSSTVIERVEAKLAEIQRMLPEGLRIVPYYQQKTLVEQCVRTVTDALIQGIILVVIIQFIFLGSLRPSVVVAVAIPFSVLFAIIGMKWLGLSINLMSFGGLAIAIGMMVDGAVVMVENVDRMLRHDGRHESRLTLVLRACREVGRPIAFAVAIIVIVFLPLFTLQGVEGKTFRPLAFAVALAMLGSLVFAIVLAPTFAYLFMRPPRRHAEKLSEEQMLPPAVRPILAAYRPVVRFFVGRPVVAIILAAVLLIAGAVTFPLLGSEFTPRLEEGTIVVRLTMAPSIDLEESKRTAMRVERRLLGIPEIVGTVTRIGRGEVGAHSDPVNSAEMFVILKPEDQWRPGIRQSDIEQQIRRTLDEVPGVLVNLTQPIQMSVDELIGGVRAELAIKVFGDEIETLKRTAEQIAGIVRTLPGAADVQVDQVTGTPQLLITVDRQAVARWGLNIADVQEVIRAAVGGQIAGQVFEGIRRFDILVRYRRQARSTPEAIRQILIETQDGARVPLQQLADVREVVGPRQITRENTQRFITVQCNVVGRDIGSFVRDAQAAIDRAVELPPGYLITWGGQFELQQAANRRLMIVIPVTLLLILLLLYSSFNSLGNCLLILLNIPLALVGGVVGLWLTGQNLSVPSSVGFIALFGIALENGMVLVAYLNQLYRGGMPIDEASIRGACLRLRPVLMTAGTTALGLIPLALATGTGSEVQRPLAVVVLGGLISSTVLTLLVLPALYRWFAPRREEVVV